MSKSSRGIPSTGLLFEVRRLAQTLSEKASLSALPHDAAHEAARQRQALRDAAGPLPPRAAMEALAEDFLRAHVVPNVDRVQKAESRGAKAYAQACWKILTDMEESQFPATLLSCLVLNLRDGGLVFKDLLDGSPVKIDRLLSVVAHDVYTAKARVLLMCQGGTLSNDERLRLKREAAVAVELLTALFGLEGLTPPEDKSFHKVAVLEEAEKLAGIYRPVAPKSDEEDE